MSPAYGYTPAGYDNAAREYKDHALVRNVPADSAPASGSRRFTDERPFVVEDADMRRPWGGGKKSWKCDLCFHEFKPGDRARWVFGGPCGMRNVFVCERCDGPVLAKLQDRCRARDSVQRLGGGKEPNVSYKVAKRW